MIIALQIITNVLCIGLGIFIGCVMERHPEPAVTDTDDAERALLREIAQMPFVHVREILQQDTETL